MKEVLLAEVHELPR